MARRRFQRGSLFQRGTWQKVWVARWWEDIIQPDGAIGRMRRSEVIGAVAELPTRRRAMQVLSERLRSVNTGSHRPQSTRTFSEFVRSDWEPVVLPTLKYATQLHYSYLFNTHLIHAFGDQRLCDISREAIQAFLTAKLRSGLSWKTVKHLRGGLSRLLGSAEEWGFITGNPAQKATLPRRERSLERAVLSLDQVWDLVQALDEPARSVALLLVLTGLRIGELLALRWRNVDLQAGVLRVAETVYDGHFDEPKTRRSVRSIPIGLQTCSILAALRADQSRPEALVFSTRAEKPLDRRNLLRRHLKPACKELGLPAIGWHSLRHCNATLLDVVGAPLGTIQALLGHASPEITREIYLHAIPTEQRRVVESLEKQVFGPKWTQLFTVEKEGRQAIN